MRVPVREVRAASRPRALVDLGGRVVVDCAIARTAEEQTRGLQDHPPLAPGEGMLFPFAPPRAATFHMGRVAFPIDVVFADVSGRVGRIIHAALPGSRARWSLPICGAVVEVPGGFCAQAGVELGDRVRLVGTDTLCFRAQTYNLLRTLTEADGPPLVDGYYSKEPWTRAPIPRSEVPPDQRFKDHRLPDESFPDAMDHDGDAGWPESQPDGWSDVGGYDAAYPPYADPIGKGDPDSAAAVRMSAQVVTDPAETYADLVEGIARWLKAGQRDVIPWKADRLNAGLTETAIVTAGDVSHWLDALPIVPGGKQVVLEAVMSKNGLTGLGDALLLAGICDLAREANGALVLSRGRR